MMMTTTMMLNDYALFFLAFIFLLCQLLHIHSMQHHFQEYTKKKYA